MGEEMHMVAFSRPMTRFCSLTFLRQKKLILFMNFSKNLFIKGFSNIKEGTII